MIYTSDKFHGQVYINWPNWLMMIGTVIVTAVYNNTTSLGNAYGTCVILVTFITTILIGLIALIVWKIHWAIVLAVWIPFATLDGLYLSSSLTKVPSGAWFTLLLATILSSVFVLWRYGKEHQWAAEHHNRLAVAEFITKNEKGTQSIDTPSGLRELNPIRGMAIFFDKAGNGIPLVFEEFVNKFQALPEVQVFLHLKNLPRPYADDEDRYEVMRTSLPNCYRLIIRYGYNDNVVTENLGDIVFKQIKQDILSTPQKPLPEDTTGSENLAERLSIRIQERLNTLENAYASQMIYVSSLTRKNIPY
jgi:KUP system potassium uptake protein